MSTILFKRSNTAGNDSYTGSLGEITIDTQARKIRIHDGVTQGGHAVANMADLDAVVDSIAGLDLELLGNIEEVVNNLASKDTTITAGDGLVGGGDLSEGRTITLGTPGTITGSSTNSVSAEGHTHQISITKADVGLSNVDNTSDADKPISTATQAALDTKANLDSPALTGTPTAPTPTVEDNSTRVATTEFVHDALESIVSGVASVSGSGAITVNNSDPANPVVGINNATTSADGAMSAADKSKLDGIEAGAQVNTVTSVAGKTGDVTVSKGDVGLSNVQNYATANQSQAVEGSSSTLYVTPAGVKAFIENGEYIIDGGTF